MSKIFYPDFFNDVFGPIMQPGSSGGFSGTARLSFLASKALKSAPASVRILFNPSDRRLKSLGTWMEDRAYLGGLLEMTPEDVGLFEAHEIARSNGLSYEFSENASDDGYELCTTFELTGADGDTAYVKGASVGGGMVRLYDVNHFKLNWASDTYALLFWGEKKDAEVLLREAEKIYDLLGDDYIASATVDDGEDRTGFFIESSRDFSDIHLNFEYRIFPPVLPVITKNGRKEQLFDNVRDWIRISKEEGLSFVDTAIKYEENFSLWSRDKIWAYFERIADILDGQIHSLEYVGYENVEETKELPIYGKNWNVYLNSSPVLTDPLTAHILTHAMSVNAKLPGVLIVPGPMGTGGGYLFSALDAVREKMGYDRKKLIEGLIVAAGFGAIAYTRSNPSGERGCVGESGVCGAMAAAAICQMAGGTPEMVENAASMSLQSSFGIPCDAIPGGKEFPCITRNFRVAADAPLYADLALAGIDPLIPFHEIIDAMEEHYRNTPAHRLCGPDCGLCMTKAAAKCMDDMAVDYMKGKFKYESGKL